MGNCYPMAANNFFIIIGKFMKHKKDLKKETPKPKGLPIVQLYESVGKNLRFRNAFPITDNCDVLQKAKSLVSNQVGRRYELTCSDKKYDGKVFTT